MSIFVSLASYRDLDCSDTLKNLYATASKPQYVYVGICEQNHPSNVSESCHVRGSGDSPLPVNNIRRLGLHHNDARGPCWARYLCSTLYQDEDYYLQIDSHMRFVKNWDQKLISMLSEIEMQSGSSKIVLSTYVREIEDYNLETQQGKDEAIPQICQAYWDSNAMINLHGASIIPRSGVAKQVPFVAGGLMFVRAKPFLDDVPYDPELKDLFTGEEILHSARVWTAGYDIFTPTENIAYHRFTRADEPKFWDDNDRDDSAAMRRVRYLLGLSATKPTVSFTDRNLDRYGMGSARSLEDYFKFAGIDPKTLTITRNFCQSEILPTPGFSNRPSRLHPFCMSLAIIILSCLLICILKVVIF